MAFVTKMGKTARVHYQFGVRSFSDLQWLPIETRIERQSLRNMARSTYYSPNMFAKSASVLPQKLINNTHEILTIDRSLQDSNADAKAIKLRNYLWSRKVPTEKKDVEQMVVKMNEELKMDAQIPDEQFAQLPLAQKITITEEVETQRKVQMAECSERLKRKVYNWQPILYDRAMCMLYLKCSLQSNFSIVRQILHEIELSDPEYKPVSLLDFGSGLGSVYWATNELWSTLKNAVFWDKSNEMLNLSGELIYGSERRKPDLEKSLVFRKSLQGFVPGQKYNLVTCCHSLLELPNQKTRLSIIDHLWNFTADDGYLVIAEDGSRAGHSIVEEARQHIIQKKIKQEDKGYLFSPCPHMNACPRAQPDSKHQCSFISQYKVYANKVKLKGAKPGSPKQMLRLMTKEAITYLAKNQMGNFPSKNPHRHMNNTSIFSYVVFKKSTCQPSYLTQPRIMSQVHNPQKDLQTATMCFPDGEVRNVAVGKQHQTELRRVIARLSCGSRIPIVGWKNFVSVNKQNTTTDDNSQHKQSPSVNDSAAELSSHEDSSQELSSCDNNHINMSRDNSDISLQVDNDDDSSLQKNENNFNVDKPL